MQFQPSSQLPDDEFYIFWYRFTKRVIGGLGAIVLYVVLESPAFRKGIDTVVNSAIAEILIDRPISAK